MIDTRHLSPYYYNVNHSPDDPRLGASLTPYSQQSFSDIDVAVVGVPTDEGIRRNGGRVGAAKSPNIIREFLAKLTPFGGPEYARQISDLSIVDFGNVEGNDLEEQHQRATELIAELTKAGTIVIAIGGGHDITYPLVKGFKKGVSSNIGLINIDAHLDVRPKKEGKHHSGSSFRLLIEDGDVQAEQFVEFGIHPLSIAKDHYDWLIAQGATVLMHDQATDGQFTQTLNQFEDTPLYLSFDADAIRGSDAPGVSAPSPYGISAELAIRMCLRAGLNPSLRMMDLVEVNTHFDADFRTVRLAARMIASFLLGIANRG